MMIPSTAPSESTIRAVASEADAHSLVAHLTDVMDALLASVDQETALVRDGHLRGASDLAPTKAELSRLYMLDTMQVKASRDFLKATMPDTLADLRRQHASFQAALQTNLNVLATAHVVSESIMRGVSDELSRKAMPQGYGASGRAMTPSRSAAQPLTISRSL